jgi:gliding motility-associated-like protein
MIKMLRTCVFLLMFLQSFFANAFNVDTLYLCKNSCILYTNVTTTGNAVAWQWTFQGANPGTSNLQNPTAICYPNAGVFLTTIKTTFDNGSDSTDQVHVVVYDWPITSFTFPKDTGYCQGGSLPLVLNTVSYPGVKYQWSTGATTRSITVNTQGKYWVNLILKAGNNVCDSVYKEVNITEYTNPSVYLGQDKFMCQGQATTLDAGVGVGYSYLWKPNNEVTRTIVVNIPGVYDVTVRTNNGCTASDQIEFKDSCPHYVFVPNAVSPNDDRLNDLFIKVWNFTPKDYKFTIYNRWGELLFETLDMNAGWDCTFKGDLVQQDVYIYKITYYDTDKKWYEMRGTFFVVR